MDTSFQQFRNKKAQEKNRTGEEIFSTVLRKNVNAKATSIFFFMWLQCCQTARTNVIMEC